MMVASLAALAPAAWRTSACGVCPAFAPGAAGDFNASSLSVAFLPTGNAAPTRGSLNVQGTTGAAGEREFLVNLGLVSNRGSEAPRTPYRDKVTLYVGAEAEAGTGDVWAINPLLTMRNNSGSYNAQAIELDFNNENAHRGEADAGAGLAPPVAYGLSVTGAAPFRSTAAIAVMGTMTDRSQGSALWNRGLVFADDCVAQSTFQDLGSPNKSVDIRGSPRFGVFQSSPTTRNLFAGKTAVGGASGASDAALDVGGDIHYSGRLLHVRRGGAQLEALLGATDASESLTVRSGNVQLGEAGGANLVLPRALRELTAAGSHRYSLTPLGAPMPSLHVSREVGIDANAELSFSIDGGVPGRRVSWQLTSALVGAL